MPRKTPCRPGDAVPKNTGLRIRSPALSLEHELIQDCLDRLNEVPGLRADFEARGRGGGGQSPDGVVCLQRGGATLRHVLELQVRPTLETARLSRNRSAGADIPPLLCARSVPPALGRALREEGLEYVDAAGNMFLDGPLGFVWIEGRSVGRKAGALPSALGVAGLKLVSVLLRRPEYLGATYRELAEAADVSLGMVAAAFSALRGQGLVGLGGDRARRLPRPLDLLRLWESGYAQRLRPKLWLGTFRPAPDHGLDGLAEAARREPGVFLAGGELGAAHLLGGLRPETAALHVRAPWREAAVRLRLLPAPDGPVTLLRDFGAVLPGPASGLAHPLFLRAELLLGRGRRLAEAAEALLRDHLLPELERHA